MPAISESPFAVLTLLAAPAILTNATTVLALGTSNRLARAADRARLLSDKLLAAKSPADPMTQLHSKDFGHALTRARLLVRALRFFYLGAASFAAGTCVTLIGASCAYFEVRWMVPVTLVMLLAAAFLGVLAIVAGAGILVGETRIAIRVLDDEQEAIEARRRATGGAG
jgi:hypothetical protein